MQMLIQRTVWIISAALKNAKGLIIAHRIFQMFDDIRNTVSNPAAIGKLQAVVISIFERCTSSPWLRYVFGDVMGGHCLVGLSPHPTSSNLPSQIVPGVRGLIYNFIMSQLWENALNIFSASHYRDSSPNPVERDVSARKDQVFPGIFDRPLPVPWTLIWSVFNQKQAFADQHLS
jgi:hypothetical protein